MSCKWQRRVERASELASTHPFASQALRFYGRLARFQKSLYMELENERGNTKERRFSGVLRDEFDICVLLPRFAPFVSHLEEVAPAPLACSAREVRLRGAARWQQLLREFWEQRPEAASLQPAEELLCRLFLQP